MPKSFEPDSKLARHTKVINRKLTITWRFVEVSDMAALTAPANYYKMGSVIAFRS